MYFGLGFLLSVLVTLFNLKNQRNKLQVGTSCAVVNSSFVSVFHVLSSLVLMAATFGWIAKNHLFGLMSFISLNYFLFATWFLYAQFSGAVEKARNNYLIIAGFLLISTLSLVGLYHDAM
ncbi:MAG: hypothetical protein ACPGUD_08745 [Parashewanella sp.]